MASTMYVVFANYLATGLGGSRFVKTTMVYTHSAFHSGRTIQSPLDFGVSPGKA
jgi:hypothetical protein